MLEQLDIHEGTMADGKTMQKERNRLMRKERNYCVLTVTHTPNAEPHCAAQGGEVSVKRRT